MLVRRAGHLVTQAELLMGVWGPKAIDKPHYLRVQLAAIRRKVEPDPPAPLLHHRFGLGLRFEPAARDLLQPGRGASPARRGKAVKVSTVLVVDDEAPILHTMDVNLRAAGYDVQLASDRHPGPRPGCPPPPRRRHLGPRAPRHRRHRRRPRIARLDISADHHPFRPHRRSSEGRRPRRRRQ